MHAGAPSLGSPVWPSLVLEPTHALVAQLDRASDFETEGREFESLRARHFSNLLEFRAGLGRHPRYGPSRPCDLPRTPPTVETASISFCLNHLASFVNISDAQIAAKSMAGHTSPNALRPNCFHHHGNVGGEKSKSGPRHPDDDETDAESCDDVRRLLQDDFPHDAPRSMPTKITTPRDQHSSAAVTTQALCALLLKGTLQSKQKAATGVASEIALKRIQILGLEPAQLDHARYFSETGMV
jgi:hypothetical protein